jgi:hypothetical protein
MFRKKLKNVLHIEKLNDHCFEELSVIVHRC